MNICSMSISTGKGTVSLLSAGASDWKVITDKFIDIYPGDKIKTSKDATGVSVTYFSDKSFLAILGGSEVEFYSEYQLYIRRGNVHVRVQKKGREFLIITPTAVCGVRGTEFDMLVNVDKSTETFLYEGVVEIRNSTDIGYLVPGEKMIAKMDEERLEQTKFNTASRKAAVWKDLDSQIQKHEQIIANSSLQKSNPNTSGNYSASSSKNQFSGVSSGSTDNQSNTKSQKENSGSSSNKPKVNSSTNNYTNNKIEICNSPDNNFHEVLINNSFEYGDASLVARCAVNVSQNTPLVVNWYLNDQTQPINVGRYSVVPKASYFDATLISYDAPINPGKYTAEFILNGQITGKSFIQIKSPQRINQADAKKIYANAIQKIDLALQYMNQGDLSGMKQKAISALPELQQALYSDGSLADILAVTQATHALIALEKMDYAVRMSNKQSAKNWLKVYSGYVNQAYSNCKDQQFRVTLQKMKDVIGKLSNEI